MQFVDRHIGPRTHDIDEMLDVVKASDMEDLLARTIPASIRDASTDLPEALSEVAVLKKLREIASQNEVMSSLIGQGYYSTVTPAVIRRRLIESPAWYTAYTPYQPEISQGRLEALLNFQTMVSDLTGMDLANASLLDEATAAAEAITLLHRASKGKKGDRFLVDRNCFPQTIAVLETRSEPLGLEIIIGDTEEILRNDTDFFAVITQYPGDRGFIVNLAPLISTAHSAGVTVCVAADLLSLTLLESPGHAGADVVVGSAQRFGVPMGYGGPHAGYMAVSDALKRSMPGRLVGVSVDTEDRPALRLALQTREQHIRRERATSNICTAQALLAIVASMYAVYHGPVELTNIAGAIHAKAGRLAAALEGSQHVVRNSTFFDTLEIQVGGGAANFVEAAAARRINVRYLDRDTIGISCDEVTSEKTLRQLAEIFGVTLPDTGTNGIPSQLTRTTEFLTHPVFNTHHSETQILRYMHMLASKDLALDKAMIPLGSCTMKLNATASLEPVSWPEFAYIHPFAPQDQTKGYQQLISDLESWLSSITGYDAFSLQPNAGSQGEYAGLLAIRSYHRSRGDDQRTVCLIPASAHGTNPASAVMAGLEVVVVATNERGEINMSDLAAKTAEYSERLAALMITYPSTHGVFEDNVGDVCKLIHDHGGQVYIDGANLNALIGLAKPGGFGGDVSHLNLHKTFSIPHGGGGPGIGPIGVGAHLAPFLPGHPELDLGTKMGPVSAAPYGSAGVLPVPWIYIHMLGAEGLRRSTEVAILSANYIAKRLSSAYPILYTGENGYVAHECIIDIRDITHDSGVTVDDIAKRLIDYGFHAPTMSFPVLGTFMIEPTESETKEELDRFIDAMLQIRNEIEEIERGDVTAEDSVLRHAPHPARDMMTEKWDRAYERMEGAYPGWAHTGRKYWSPVSRIDGGYGDRNLVCACVAIEEYQ